MASSDKEEKLCMEALKKVASSVVHITLPGSSGTGTGFIINSQGDILTCNHVVRIVDEAIVKKEDGTSTTATVKYRATDVDLAVLSADAFQGHSHVLLSREHNVEKLRTVLAVGNPRGLTFSATKGVVSNGKSSFGGLSTTTIQFDCPAINRGSSGSPVFYLSGEVIGIEDRMLADGGEVVTGFSFAVPVETIKTFLRNNNVGFSEMKAAVSDWPAKWRQQLNGNRVWFLDNLNFTDAYLLDILKQDGILLTPEYRAISGEHDITKQNRKFIEIIERKSLSQALDTAVIFLSQQEEVGKKLAECCANAQL